MRARLLGVIFTLINRFMKSKEITNEIANFGRGILYGIGCGTSLFGLVFIAKNYASNQDIGITSLVTILAGIGCILLAGHKSFDSRDSA